MNTFFIYKPGFKFKIRDDVHAFNENGLFATEDELLQTVLEKSPPFISGDMKKKIEPLRVAVKIYSPILEGYLWVVQDTDDWPHLRCGDAPVYDAHEIRELEARKLSPDELKVAHEVKKVFKGTIQGKE